VVACQPAEMREVKVLNHDAPILIGQGVDLKFGFEEDISEM